MDKAKEWSKYEDLKLRSRIAREALDKFYRGFNDIQMALIGDISHKTRLRLLIESALGEYVDTVHPKEEQNGEERGDNQGTGASVSGSGG